VQRPGWATTAADWSASAAGASVVMKAAHGLGVDTRGMRLVDGSGVSIQNMVTPRTTLQLLQAKRDDVAWDSFMTVAAVNGTLATRFAGTVAAGELR
jgi:D-alanyl-D-alanine carboxypeptidase/D-alanyl-D-alanine-endopeptidase (penicillin-binding protein 4)